MSDLVPPRVRRNNLLTLILLILFAIGLCAFVLISMRIHAQRRAANPEAAQFGVRRHDAAFSGRDMSRPALMLGSQIQAHRKAASCRRTPNLSSAV